MPPARQAKGTLSTLEVPGSFLLDVLLFWQDRWQNTAGKPNPALPACSGSFTPQTRKWGEGQTLHNPTLWTEHLENKMLATTPVSARGRSQAAHRTEGACHSPKGGDEILGVFRMPSPGDQNPTRVSVSLLDWEGALFSQEKRGIVWTEWLWGIRPTSLVQIYNILPPPPETAQSATNSWMTSSRQQAGRKAAAPSPGSPS